MGFNKLAFPLEGTPLVTYPYRHLREAGTTKVVVVIGHERQLIMQCLGTDDGTVYVNQETQLGTADAALQALPALGDAEQVVVLFGDCPFLDSVAINGIINHHITSGADLTLATAILSQARAYGRLRRDDAGAPVRVQDARQAPSLEPGEVFAGLSVWTKECYEQVLPQLPEHRRTETAVERDLPDAVEVVHGRGGKVSTFPVDAADALAPNEKDEFAEAADYMRRKVKYQLQDQGVVIPDFTQVRVDHTARVGKGTRLNSNTQVLGVTQIGERCTIGPGTTLRDCIVEDGCEIGRGTFEGLPFAAGSKASDRLAREHLYFRRNHYLIPEETDYAFMITPFDDAFLRRFENVIRPVLGDMGYRCETVADSKRDGSIVEDIWTGINRSSLVIADITEPKPNVWYELGIAHALNKRVLMLRQRDVAPPPFDISTLRIHFYSLVDQDLANVLRSYLNAGTPTSG